MSKRVNNKKKSKKSKLPKIIAIILFLLSVYGILYSINQNGNVNLGLFGKLFPTKKVEKTDVTKMYLTPNEYSRPQTRLHWVKGVVVHYTANPGSTAKNNRNYFENLKDTKETYASSHFVIGLDGEIIQCMPLNEIAYASNKRNADTISIECCHEDETGKLNEKTYRSLVRLVAWLCGEYNLKKNDIIRHYDVTGKICPKYFVDHEEKWVEFRNTVFEYIDAFKK